MAVGVNGSPGAAIEQELRAAKAVCVSGWVKDAEIGLLTALEPRVMASDGSNSGRSTLTESIAAAAGVRRPGDVKAFGGMPGGNDQVGMGRH